MEIGFKTAQVDGAMIAGLPLPVVVGMIGGYRDRKGVPVLEVAVLPEGILGRAGETVPGEAFPIPGQREIAVDRVVTGKDAEMAVTAVLRANSRPASMSGFRSCPTGSGCRWWSGISRSAGVHFP